MRAKNEYMLMSEAYSKVHGDVHLITEKVGALKKILRFKNLATAGKLGIGGSIAYIGYQVLTAIQDFMGKNKWLIPAVAAGGGLYVANKVFSSFDKDDADTDINITIENDPEDDDIRDPEGFQKVNEDDIVDTEEVEAVDAEDFSLDSAKAGDAFLTTAVKEIAKDQGVEINEEEDIVGYLQQFGQWQLLDTQAGQLALKVA